MPELADSYLNKLFPSWADPAAELRKRVLGWKKEIPCDSSLHCLLDAIHPLVQEIARLREELADKQLTINVLESELEDRPCQS